MPLHFDHAVIAVKNLETAINNYHELGFTVFRGGVHANRATENALIVFVDGTYLELLAKTNEQPVAGVIDFSVLLQKGEGLVGYALRSDDLEADAARLKAHGFAVGEIIHGERRRGDGVVIQWKLALIDGGFAPFLIEDVTPRELRVSNDEALTTHANRAIGVRGVQVAVQDIKAATDRYKRLFSNSTRKVTNHGAVECVRLLQHIEFYSKYSPDQLPDYLQMFGGNVPQAEIDAADPALEPKFFERQRKLKASSWEDFRKGAERERALGALLKDSSEALFAIELIREQRGDERFMLERTHGVRFQQLTGAPAQRGEKILLGLNDVDWSAVQHAYGPATDVPELLRALASDDKDVRQHAYGMMINGNIVHQGTVYEASVETIPFLTQLVNAPEVEDKGNVLDLLESIIFGGSHDAALKDRIQVLLQDALPVYLAQLNSPDARVRLQIVGQLPMYEMDAEIFEPLLQELVTKDEAPSVRAQGVETLAQLWTKKGNDQQPLKFSTEQAAYFAGLMRDSSQPLAVQFKAARVLVQNNPDAWLDEGLRLFYRMMQVDEETLKSLVNFEFGRILLANILYSMVETLHAYPDKAVEWVLAQAQHPNAEIRETVPNALREFINKRPVSEMIPAVLMLMRDPSPDVRESAVGFFYQKPYAREVVDVLKDVAAHDVSLTVRVVAGNVLKHLNAGTVF